MKKVFILFFVFILCYLLFLTQEAYAEKFNIDPEKSDIYFKIDHLVGLNSGFIKKFDGTVNIDKKNVLKSFRINVDPASLTTFNEARDGFLKGEQFFDTEQFPEMILKSKKITKEGGVLAELQFRDIRKEIKLFYIFSGKGKDKKGKERVVLSLIGDLNRRDFGIDYNRKTDEGNDLLGNTIGLLINLEGVSK